MSVTATPALMTTEELLALPEDGVERWLIRGRLREKARPYHDRWHSRTLARIGSLLGDWLDQHSERRGEVFMGGVGCRLQRLPDTTLGVDLAYLSAELASRQAEQDGLIEGAPFLAVEVLSPDDTVGEINEKVDAYLQAGVVLIWVLDPHDRTVLVYRPGAEPELFNARQELSGEPELPRFRVAVARIFER